MPRGKSKKERLSRPVKKRGRHDQTEEGEKSGNIEGEDAQSDNEEGKELQLQEEPPGDGEKPGDTGADGGSIYAANTSKFQKPRKQGGAKKLKKKKPQQRISKKKGVHCNVGELESDHILSDEIYLECINEASLACHDSGLSPRSSQEVRDSTTTSMETSNRHQCPKCEKSYSTKRRFYEHLLAHGIEAANSRRPKAEDIFPLVEGLVTNCLEEIQSEFGSEKAEFVKAVLLSVNTRYLDWSHFIQTFAEPFIVNLSNPTKIIPSNQYEEQLVALNKLLNDPEKASALLDGLKFLNGEDLDPESPVPSLVLFRLTSKFLDKLIVSVFEKMKETQENQLLSLREMNEGEQRAFQMHLRKLIQNYYLKGLRIKSELWILRCACIRECFLEVLYDCDELAEVSDVDVICRDESWTEDEDGQIKVKLCDTATNFFLHVEKIIDSLLVSKEVELNPDAILSVIFLPVNSTLLDDWHSLTALHFSEMEGLMFLKDLISMVLNLSLRLEVGMLQSEANERMPKYALRTDLKRN